MHLHTAHDVGNLIRGYRLAQHLSQNDLAERVGVSRLWIVQTERGNPGASLELVLRTLATLGIALRADTESSPETPSVDGPDIDAILNAARRR